jgi:predicted Zn-dependent protease
MWDKDFCASVIKRLTAQTKYYATVNIEGGREAVTRFANSEINQNTQKTDATVSLTLHDGKKEATCATNVLSDEGLNKLVRDAEELLTAAPEGEFEAFPNDMEDDVPDAPNDARLAEVFGAEGRAEAVKRGVESLGGGCTAAGALTLETRLFAYGNSGTEKIRHAAFDAVLFNTVVTHESGAAGGAECISRAGGANIQAAFDTANDRALRSRDPVSCETGAYTVILSPAAFGDLLAFVCYSLDAKETLDGTSFAIGRLGQRVFGGNITVLDDARHPLVFPLCFDYEGRLRQTLPLIENGVVESLLHDDKTAARMNTRSTGHAFTNKGYGGYSMHTVARGGDMTLEEMIKDTPRGIFISELHYTNYVNQRMLQITGLTRNGTFLIENGELTRAVATMRFTQELIAALCNVTALSAADTAVNINGWASVMPAARIDGFTFTS